MTHISGQALPFSILEDPGAVSREDAIFSVEAVFSNKGLLLEVNFRPKISLRPKISAPGSPRMTFCRLRKDS